MTVATIPFELAGFVIDTVQENADLLVISAHSTAIQAACPDCGTVTHCIHSAQPLSTARFAKQRVWGSFEPASPAIPLCQ
jgi:hypothetical protein